MQNMTSNRPYLLRAVYEWIVDNGMTPLILVDDSSHESDADTARPHLRVIK